MTDKEILLDIVLDKLSVIPSKMFGINMGGPTKNYFKQLALKQLPQKYPMIDMLFVDDNLYEADMFFDCLEDIISNSQLNVLGVGLDNSFLTEVKREFKARKGVL